MSSNKYNRRSIRLPEYDYSLPGEYFITICIYERECLLGNVIDGVMKLNDYGKCVDGFWEALPSHYERLSLGEWVVMPNHVHGILIINEPVGAIDEHVGAIHESPLQERRQMLLSKIIGRFKMNAGKQINTIRQTTGQPVWQRNYYEHIIRNAKSYSEIENYIRSNPLNWLNDKNNPGNIKRT